MNCGVCYVAFGEAARREAAASVASFKRRHRDIPVVALGEEVKGTYSLTLKYGDLNNVQASRWTKVGLYDLSPFEHTLYVDADTRINGSLRAGWKMLDDGWDMVITPSQQQGAEALWHVGAEEREATFDELALLPMVYQGGMFFFAKNERTKAFFDAWKDEWQRWKNQDQGALLRALWRAPVRVHLLGYPFGNGAVVAHKFGRARKDN